MSSQDPHHFHKEYPKTRSETDFWGQVKRTVNGQSVSEEQIAQIVATIQDHLQLTPNDVLLDLGCANGALTDRLFGQCRGGVGVDFSEYLIGIAHKYFQQLPDRVYVLGDAVDFVNTSPDTQRFTKALCYGVFQYLPADSARSLLTALRQRFPQVGTFFIGNLPNKAKMHDFFRERDYQPGVENDPYSAIGIWRTEEEFTALAADCGWSVTCSHMPKDFFAAHYRFDALLKPLP
jgi:cyclopropane fatty-acyl-phospholipid synthase-like methyltransferase